MEIKYVAIIFAGIIPFIIYSTLLTILIIRLLKDKGGGIDPYLLIRHIIFVFIISSLYLTFSLKALFGKSQNMKIDTDLLVMLVYIISLFFSCVNYLHSRFIGKMPYYLNILTIVFALIILYASVRTLIAGNYPLLKIIFKILVIATILFLVCDHLYRCYREDSEFVRNRTFYVRLMSLYNFIYLFYLIKIHPALNLIFAGYAYISVYAVEFYFLRLWKKPQKYNYESDEEYTLLEEASNVFMPGSEESKMPYNNLHDYKKEAISLKNRLLLYFEQEKPYLSKNISIEEVAIKLYTNKTYLSKTINEELNKNFRELVNYFRIREAMKIYSRNMEIPMSELMDRSGFNNNASFTSAFKVNTGQTPREWCRDIKSKN